MCEVAKNGGIYVSASFVTTLLTWYAVTKAKGATWYFDNFTPRIGVLTLKALLFTIIVLFASQSTRISSNLGYLRRPASNKFELALAVAIASFGLKSDPAQMSVVGAFIEIPTMLALVYLAFWFRPGSIRYSQGFGSPAREALECVEASATAPEMKWRRERREYEETIRSHAKESTGDLIVPVKNTFDEGLLRMWCLLRWHISIDDVTDAHIMDEVDRM
ncbi:arsenical-resistance protein [Phytophthora cinnamomi]|uniref:arsenical-resistance protein n=1 Tax=Phytophthora cinnamomi TaxID=4785 RepID=UPI003559C990|nr:arsenical-resistance protein [Phytophthora cinnamomi]